jgi:hypothetical protein
MSQQFLVELIDALDDDPPFARIPAPDAPTAIWIFLTMITPTDEPFLQYVYATSITLSFAEYFWIRTDADDALLMQGALHVSDDAFAERVQRFFGARRDYAELYLRYYFSADGAAPPRGSFPPEMLAFIWLHTRYGAVRAIPVAEG